MSRSFPRVLFVCVRNAGRSQMAEAVFNRLVDGRGLARSAGSRPAAAVHPVVIEVLQEIGIDVSASRPKALSPSLVEEVSVVVNMGCGDACPALPGVRTVEWDVPDPAGRTKADVRAIREEIIRLVEDLIHSLDGRKRTRAPWGPE